jgi:hypothetical protein
VIKCKKWEESRGEGGSFAQLGEEEAEELLYSVEQQTDAGRQDLEESATDQGAKVARE